MDRINSANVNVVSGKRYFQDLNLAANTRGTQVNAVFLNNTQEELMYIIETAGLTGDSTNTTQVLQALGTLFGGEGSLNSTGYMRLPGGLIVQWGSTVLANVGVMTGQNVTLPLTFPTNFWQIVVSDYGTGAVSLGARPNTLSTFTVAYSVWGSPTGCRWIAIGD